jgi:hypothetical protein
MKLYDVQRGSVIKILPQLKEEEIKDGESAFEGVRTPVDSADISLNQYLVFSHVDGMYSFCYDMNGNVVHPAAWTEVEVVPQNYENHGFIRNILKRGGRGKDGLQPLKWVPISEMNDEWLSNTITYVEERGGVATLYRNEQRYRTENNISISENEE